MTPQLVDFTSYDLGRMLELLHEAGRTFSDPDPGPQLRAAAIAVLPWDRRQGTAFNDPAFVARYSWLRSQLPVDGGNLAAVIAGLDQVLASRQALEVDP